MIAWVSMRMVKTIAEIRSARSIHGTHTKTTLWQMQIEHYQQKTLMLWCVPIPPNQKIHIGKRVSDLEYGSSTKKYFPALSDPFHRDHVRAHRPEREADPGP